MDARELEKIRKQIQKLSEEKEKNLDYNKKQLDRDVENYTDEIESLDQTQIAYGISKAQSEERKKQRELKIKRNTKILLVGTTVVALLGTNIANSIISYKKGYNNGARNESEITGVNLEEMNENYTFENAPDELLLAWSNYAITKYQETQEDVDNIDAMNIVFDNAMTNYTKYSELKDEFYTQEESKSCHDQFMSDLLKIDDAVRDEYKFKTLFAKAVIDENGVIKLPKNSINYDFSDNSDYIQNDDNTVVYIPVDELYNEDLKQNKK